MANNEEASVHGRFGYVSNYDPQRHMAQIRFPDKDNLVSAWIPVAISNSQKNRDEVHLDPVFVLAVKGTTDPVSGTASDTVTYSFLNMEDLVDVYTIASGDSSKILSIANNAISVHISTVANNAITVQKDGLHVDISAKADKVSGATAGNIASLDANGNITDSGISVATTAQVTEMINEVYGTPSGN